MATRSELEAALINADAAGDEQAARAFATAINGGNYTAQESKGFIDRVSDRFDERGEKFGKDMSQATDDMLSLNPLEAMPANLRAIRRTGGMVTGAVGDVIGEGLMSAASYLPESWKEGAQEAVQAVAETDTAKSISETYAKFKRGNPELDQSIRDTANMLGVIPLAKATSLVGQAGVDTAKTTGNILRRAIPQSANKQDMARLIDEGSNFKETAGLKLDAPNNPVEGLFMPKTPRVTKNPIETEAINQGFSEGFITSARTGTKADKKAFRDMVRIKERGIKDADYGATNRATDVIGKNLHSRYKNVKAVNKRAGMAIDKVAKSLKNKPFDTRSVEISFVDDLKAMGVKIDGDNNLNFTGSDIQNLPKLEKIVTDITNRMKDVGMPNAYAAHQLKRHLDTVISHGKLKQGLEGKTERLLSNLRRNVDSQLDGKYPRYDTVNKVYAETINSLNGIQKAAGSKVDLTGSRAASALGTMVRGVTSNNKSRDALINALDDIDKVSKKYGGKHNDSLIKQAITANELDRVFKPSASTGLQGQLIEGIETAGAGLATGGKSTVIQGVKKATELIKGVNEDNAFKALHKLFRE